MAINNQVNHKTAVAYAQQFIDAAYAMDSLLVVHLFINIPYCTSTRYTPLAHHEIAALKPKLAELFIAEQHSLDIIEVESAPLNVDVCQIWLRRPLVLLFVEHLTELNVRSTDKPHPRPALRYLERYLVVDADRLALAALLIVRPIGSAQRCFLDDNLSCEAVPTPALVTLVTAVIAPRGYAAFAVTAVTAVTVATLGRARCPHGYACGCTPRPALPCTPSAAPGACRTRWRQRPRRRPPP